MSGPTTSKRFSAVFDPKKEEHVRWLQDLHLLTLDEQDPEQLMKKNPFELAVSNVDVLNWVDVMFSLSLKYTMAVLEGRAWVPPQKE